MSFGEPFLGNRTGEVLHHRALLPTVLGSVVMSALLTVGAGEVGSEAGCVQRVNTRSTPFKFDDPLGDERFAKSDENLGWDSIGQGDIPPKVTINIFTTGVNNRQAAFGGVAPEAKIDLLPIGQLEYGAMAEMNGKPVEFILDHRTHELTIDTCRSDADDSIRN